VSECVLDQLEPLGHALGARAKPALDCGITGMLEVEEEAKVVKDGEAVACTPSIERDVGIHEVADGPVGRVQPLVQSTLRGEVPREEGEEEAEGGKELQGA